MPTRRAPARQRKELVDMPSHSAANSVTSPEESGSGSRESRKRAHLEQKESQTPLVAEPKAKTSKMNSLDLRTVPSVSSLSSSMGSSFSVYEEDQDSYISSESDDSQYSEYDDENRLAAIENPEFRQTAEQLNEECVEKCGPPHQLTRASTEGLGSPEKVWGLMLRLDEVLRPSPSLLLRHTTIEPRKRYILLDWMMEVCEDQKQHRETLHLAIDYVDRFLANTENVRIEQYQLLGLTAIFVASKYEEIYPPSLKTFALYTDGGCTEEEVRSMEIVMLEKLQWNLSPITAIQWLAFFMQMLGRKEILRPLNNVKEGPEQRCVVPNLMVDDFIHMARILDLSLMDVRSLKFTFRELAAAVMFNCLEPQKVIAQCTGVSPSSISSVIEWVEPFVRYCDQRRIAGDPIPHHEGIRPDDLHNIQAKGLYSSIDEAMMEIEKDRKDLAYQAREIRQAGKRAILRARLRT